MNGMFFNSQCPIFPDEYAIGKIVEPDRKNRTLRSGTLSRLKVFTTSLCNKFCILIAY